MRRVGALDLGKQPVLDLAWRLRQVRAAKEPMPY